MRSPELREPEPESESEPEPFTADLRVDFIRYGESSHTETDMTLIEQEAQQLVAGIDSNQETIVIWSSPNQRSQKSAEVINDILRQQGIEVLQVANNNEVREIGSMHNTTVGSEGLREIIDQDSFNDLSGSGYYQHIVSCFRG